MLATPLLDPEKRDEWPFLSDEIMLLRATGTLRRMREEYAKALAAFPRRHEPRIGTPEGWKTIARQRLHSARIARLYAGAYCLELLRRGLNCDGLAG